MKKALSFILVATMLFAMMSGSFSTVASIWESVSTAEEFAAMTDGDYKLTADIDLSEISWTKIAEFSGVLDGNGHTISVPADAPIFDKLTGTVKNVHLMGTCVLNADDSSNTILGDCVAMFANYAYGATIENVISVADVTYNSDTVRHFGGFIGVAIGAYGDGFRSTVIRNCIVSGNIVYSTTAGNNYSIGGLASQFGGGVEVYNTEVSADITISGGDPFIGGFVGQTVSKENCSPSLIENCLYSGTMKISKSNRSGAYVGYNNAFTIKNSFARGSIDVTSGNVAHLAGYGNSGSSNTPNNNTAIIDGCASVAAITGGGKHFSRIKNNNSYLKNIIVGPDQPIGDTNNDSKHRENITTKDTLKAVALEFVKRNSEVFKFENGKVVFAHGCDHLWGMSGGNELVSDVCYYCGAKRDFSGFVQFAETPAATINIARIIMIIDDSVLEADANGMLEYENFDLTVTADGKSYTVNSEDLYAFVEVTAAGETYTTNGCQAFGLVVDFGESAPVELQVTLTAGEKVLFVGYISA